MLGLAPVEGKHRAPLLQQGMEDHPGSGSDIRQPHDGMVCPKEFFSPVGGDVFQFHPRVHGMMVKVPIAEDAALQISAEGRNSIGGRQKGKGKPLPLHLLLQQPIYFRIKSRKAFSKCLILHKEPP